MDTRLQQKETHLHVGDGAINRGVPVRTTAVASEAYGFLGVGPPG